MNDNLIIQTEYYNHLDIDAFSRMLKDPSYCYKFYWLEAIVELISGGRESATFDEIITEMIINAWYSVVEFHIHLSGLVEGVSRDGLERAVNVLAELTNLSSNSSKVEIRNQIIEHGSELREAKKQLTNMVPYRALAGFFEKYSNTVPWDSVTRIVEYANLFNERIEALPYTYDLNPGLKKRVTFNKDWMQLIQDNTVNILGWIQFEKLKWLQMNNPEVPGLVYKLKALDDKNRKLEHVRTLWKGILSLHGINDVFTNEPIDPAGFDVDHFIPFSFVMNDELRNLMPMDSSLNSAKSNLLPKWDGYFELFAKNQFKLYEDIHQYDGIRNLYEKCYKDNLHSIWASQELYRKGNSKEEFINILEKNMRPIYDSAKRQGYAIWSRR